MNAELPPFKNGEHNSESASSINRVITPLRVLFIIAIFCKKSSFTNLCLHYFLWCLLSRLACLSSFHQAEVAFACGKCVLYILDDQRSWFLTKRTSLPIGAVLGKHKLNPRWLCASHQSNFTDSKVTSSSKQLPNFAALQLDMRPMLT